MIAQRKELAFYGWTFLGLGVLLLGLVWALPRIAGHSRGSLDDHPPEV